MPRTALRKYVVIAGNICAGKTTVVESICDGRPGCTGMVETREPFLADYYAEPARFAFINQLGYTVQFLKKAAAVATTSDTAAVVQDRCIYEAHNVFSQLCVSTRRITPSEFDLLERLVRYADAIIRPTHLVLLEAPVEELFRRASVRGDPAEEQMTFDYLVALARAYEAWFDEFNLCPKYRMSTDGATPSEVAEEVAGAVGL